MGSTMWPDAEVSIRKHNGRGAPERPTSANPWVTTSMGRIELTENSALQESSAEMEKTGMTTERPRHRSTQIDCHKLPWGPASNNSGQKVNHRIS